MKDDASPDPLVPKRELADDLSALYREEIDVPAGVDEAVLHLARRALEGRRRPWVLRRPLAAASVAALLLLGVLGVWASFYTGSRQRAPAGARAPLVVTGADDNQAPAPRAAMRAPVPEAGEPSSGGAEALRAEDIDASGRVDIVDALVLARRVADRQPLRKQWDFNRDGRVDRGDADEVAMLAVRLK